MDEITYPKLREIQIIPVLESGKKVFCLVDPMRISPDPVILNPEKFFIASRLD